MPNSDEEVDGEALGRKWLEQLEKESEVRRKSVEKQKEELQCVGYLPERFTTGYFELVRLGLKIDPSGQQYQDNGSPPKGRRFVTHGGGLRDEQALRVKAWVDRQLRAIGRDVQAYLNARAGNSFTVQPGSDDESVRRTGREIAREIAEHSELKCRNDGCKRYVSWQWTYCAWCGTPVTKGNADNASHLAADAGGQAGRS